MVLSEITQRTIQVIRSELIASKDGLSTDNIRRCYVNFFGKELGTHHEVDEWLYDQTTLCRRHPTKDVWLAVQNEDTAHVQKLVGKQKPVKRKPAPPPRPNALKEAERRATRSTTSSFNDSFGGSYSRNERTIMTRSQNGFGRSTKSSFSRSIKKVNEKYEDYNDMPNSNWESNSNSYSPCDDQVGSDNELDSEHFGSKRSVSVRDTPSFEEQPKGIIHSSNRTTGFGRGQGVVSSETKCQIGRQRQSSSSFGSSDSDQSDARIMMTRCQQRSSSQQQAKSPLSPVLRKRRDQQKQQMLNSEKSASLAGSRPNSSINRQNKTASRSHVKKVLVDAINSHGGEMLLEKLLDIFNQEFMIKRLGKHAVPLPKLIQLIENLKSSELIINGDVVLIKKEETIQSPTNQCVDCATQTEETLFQGTSDEKVQLLVERLDKLENTLLSKQSMMFDQLLTVASELVDAFQTNLNGKSLYHKNNNNTETTVSKL